MKAALIHDRRLFDLMDTSHNGGIDFIEFVVAMWNFCTLTPRALT